MALIQYLLYALHTFILITNAHSLAQAKSYDETPNQVHGQHIFGGDPVSSAKHERPFYAITHRVLSSSGVTAALSQGANALEIDMKAHANDPLEPRGYRWWAQHDPLWFTAGDTAETIFETIAHQKHQGKNVIFVWLDIKTPDKCRPSTPNEYACSIERLRGLARKILEPAGIQVLYGFVLKDVRNRAFGVIRDGLNSNEAVDLEGAPDDVRCCFSSQKLGKTQSVMSRGLFNMRLWFGT